LQRIDRTLKRCWHWKLELNYEEFAQKWVTYRQQRRVESRKDRVGSQARLVFVLWRRCANTRAPTYSLML
jgi:hypothetical protein